MKITYAFAALLLLSPLPVFAQEVSDLDQDYVPPQMVMSNAAQAPVAAIPGQAPVQAEAVDAETPEDSFYYSDTSENDDDSGSFARINGLNF